MVQGIPYVHWKIKDAVDLTEIDPVYLWGTVIETDKGPLNTPVFCTNAEQVKRIFNYNLEPFFVNGGRSVVVIRAYAGQPKEASFDFQLNEDFKYVYADYDYYNYEDDDTSVKATVIVDNETAEKPKPLNAHYYSFTSYSDADKSTQYGTGTVKTTGVVKRDEENQNIKYVQVQVLENEANTSFVGKKYYVVSTADATTPVELLTQPKTSTDSKTNIFVTVEETSVTIYVRFFEGRWRSCDENGNIKYFDEGVLKVSKYNKTDNAYYKAESTTFDDADKVDPSTMQSFNESDVNKIVVAKIAKIEENSSVINLKTVYPGDFQIPVTVAIDARQGYRVSVKESDDYTILLSGATTLENITKRINERASNVVATITDDGKNVEKPFKAALVSTKNAEGTYILPKLSAPENEIITAYTTYIQEQGIPVGSIFAKVPENEEDSEDFKFKLIETITYLADGSNGVWNKNVYRIADTSNLQNRQLIAAAHKEALDHLATIKLSGIFCNYGEDEVQKVYTDHVSTTEPQGMNSAEVCKWRTLILGANAFDRTNDDGDTSGFNLVDKAISLDNENILFLGQGLIDDGYAPESNVMKKEDGYVPLIDDDTGALPHQLLPFQCTQYVAGLRSKLFYGDAIFGGEAKKEIVGVGNISIAPLFAGENKLLWQPDNYATLNQYGVLTFTNDYNLLSLTDGVTTRQTPLEEDEEGVQSIIKYAKHIVHEDLQRFIGRNLTGDLEQVMENSVKALLGVMQTQDQTLVAVPSEGLPAYDVDIVLIPKSNAQQLLAKAYVYLKLTPVHALRQVEVELTVQ